MIGIKTNLIKMVFIEMFLFSEDDLSVPKFINKLFISGNNKY